MPVVPNSLDESIVKKTPQHLPLELIEVLHLTIPILIKMTLQASHLVLAQQTPLLSTDLASSHMPKLENNFEK
jgi:hypothetical protein